MFRIGMALVMCGVVGIVGCVTSPTTGGAKADQLVGTWEASEPEMKGITLVFAFTADGKFTQETVIAGMPKEDNVKVDGGKQEGTYKLEDKNLVLSVKGKEKKITIKEISDSKAILISAEGKELTFTKKK